MKKSPILTAFDDAEELNIERDNESITRIFGSAYHKNVCVKITIHRNDSGSTVPMTESSKPKHKELYTGTISLWDPASTRVMLSEAKRRKLEEAGKEYKDKDIYASRKFRCNSSDESTISDEIMRHVLALIKENSGQLEYAIAKVMQPEQVNPNFAAEKYAAEYLRLNFPNATPEKNLARQKQIAKVLNYFPQRPIGKIKKSETKTLLDEHNVPDKARKLCSEFFDYLINTGKCVGKNPIVSSSQKTPSEYAQNKAAFSVKELGDEVFKKLYLILNKKISSVNCAISLLASGLSREDVFKLKWGDLDFTDDKDYLIVHLWRNYSGVSKHDFSRPLIINTARYLNKAYHAFRKDDKNINDKLVFPLEERAAVNFNEEVNNVLVRAGYDGTLAIPGRPADGVEAIPLTILQTNYQRMLYSKAGLKDDPDTLSFLCGRLFKSSTFINYESHTSPEAQRRLFTILKPLAVEEILKEKSGIVEINEETHYRAVPESTHQTVRVFGDLELQPGQRIVLRIPHGVTGYIEKK